MYLSFESAMFDILCGQVGHFHSLNMSTLQVVVVAYLKPPQTHSLCRRYPSDWLCVFVCVRLVPSQTTGVLRNRR